jgi:hypothetical protein
MALFSDWPSTPTPGMFRAPICRGVQEVSNTSPQRTYVVTWRMGGHHIEDCDKQEGSRLAEPKKSKNRFHLHERLCVSVFSFDVEKRKNLNIQYYNFTCGSVWV